MRRPDGTRPLSRGAPTCCFYPLGLADESDDPLAGSDRKIADAILELGESAAMAEVRCYLVSDETPDGRRRALDAMAEVARLVRAA